MENSWNQARVLDASDRDYLETVLALLESAQKEIVIAFYLIEPDDKEGIDHPVNRFLECLRRARERGLTVRLILNTNFRFRPKTEVGNGSWFERMTLAGIEITALLPSRRLHDKLIVIDGRYVVDGSMNWSEAALTFNFESATIIDSPDYATKKLARIAAMTLPLPPRPAPVKKNTPDLPILPAPETAWVPAAILQKNYLPHMIRTSDMRAVDLYLFLLGQKQAAGTDSFEIDLETAGLALGLPKNWKRSALRRQMIKTLNKLSKSYKLLDLELPYAGNAKIMLKELPGERIEVPGRLLSPDYLARADSAETFLDIAGEMLKKGGVLIDSLSAPELARRFGIGKSAVVRARKKQTAIADEDEN